MKLLRALKLRRFALLFFGQTVSRVGDHLYQLALAWWVLEKTGSALDMGTVMICSFMPMLIFLVVGGVAVDRLPRVGIMVVSDVARGLLVLMVAALALANRLTVLEVYVASVLFGLVDAFFTPAYTAVLPDLVPEEQLNSANALTSLSMQLGRIAGPPLAALLIHFGGTGWAFGLNAVSFGVSALFLLPLLGKTGRRAMPEETVGGLAEQGAERSMAAAGAGDGEEVVLVSEAPPVAGRFAILAEARAGIGYVLSRPWLWVTILTCTAANVLLGGPYSVTLPFLIQKTRGADVGTLALVYAMFPIGYALAAVTSGQMERLPRRGLTIFVCMAMGGLALGLFGLPVPLVVLCAAAIVNGYALEIAGLAWTHVMQEKVPSDMLGRVSSIDSLGSYAILPVGYALAGWATDALSPAWVFLIGGFSTAVLAVAGLMSRSIRRLK